MADIANQVIVNFEEDSENSVSLATARALMTISGAPSLEALIQLSLAAYSKNMEIAFPLNEEVSTSEHWTRIARLYPKGLHLKSVFCKPDEHEDNKSVSAKKYPTDDGLPSPEQLAAIARITPQHMPLKTISSLFENHSDNKADVCAEYTLQELMSNVTEENKHELIDFGKPVGKEML
jgi:hypothetical protein